MTIPLNLPKGKYPGVTVMCNIPLGCEVRGQGGSPFSHSSFPLIVYFTVRHTVEKTVCPVSSCVAAGDKNASTHSTARTVNIIKSPCSGQLF